MLSYLKSHIKQSLTKFMSSPLRTLFSPHTIQKRVTPTEVTWLYISSYNNEKSWDVQCGNKPVSGLSMLHMQPREMWQANEVKKMTTLHISNTKLNFQ